MGVGFWACFEDWTGAGAAPLFGIQAAVYNLSLGQLFVSSPNGTGETVCTEGKYSVLMDVIRVTSARFGRS